jgi:hypothetical protein
MKIVVMSAKCQFQTHAPQQISSLFDHPRAARRSGGLMVDDDASRRCLKGSSDPSSRATFAILYNQSPWIDIALRYHRARTALEGEPTTSLFAVRDNSSRRFLFTSVSGRHSSLLPARSRFRPRHRADAGDDDQRTPRLWKHSS